MMGFLSLFALNAPTHAKRYKSNGGETKTQKRGDRIKSKKRRKKEIKTQRGKKDSPLFWQRF